jgi:hypothetical protein
MVLIPSYFEHQKDGVDDETGDDQAERDDAEDQDAQRRPLGRDDDPADIQRDCRRDEKNAQGDENAIAFWRRVMRGILGIQNAKLKIPLIPVYTKKGV